jgi:hypothetical protein
MKIIVVNEVGAEPRLMHDDVACVSPFGSPADPAVSVPPPIEPIRSCPSASIEIELCLTSRVFGTIETDGTSTLPSSFIQ